MAIVCNISTSSDAEEVIPEKKLTAFDCTNISFPAAMFRSRRIFFGLHPTYSKQVHVTNVGALNTRLPDYLEVL